MGSMVIVMRVLKKKCSKYVGQVSQAHIQALFFIFLVFYAPSLGPIA